MALNLQHVGRARDHRSTIAGPRGPGRPVGTPNNINSDVRAMILEALNGAGGARYLQRQAIENPGPFMSLLGRILPREMVDERGTSVHLHLLAALQIQPQQLEPQRQAEPQRQPLVIEGTPSE